MQLGIPLSVVTSVRRARPCHRNAQADPRRGVRSKPLIHVKRGAFCELSLNSKVLH